MPLTRDSSLPHATLASEPLPGPVRRALEQLFALVSDDMAAALERMLGEFEQQLFRMADQAPNPGMQQSHFETLRLFRQSRADLIPQFLSGLEGALASVRRPPEPARKAANRLQFAELRLVEEEEVDEDSILRGIAARHEARSSLALHLLGQRFGVLAGAPAFEAERLPVGPRQLGRLLADASRVFQINRTARLELFRCFDLHGLNGYAHLVDAMNAALAKANVLPDLAYVPVRARPAALVERSGEASRQRREHRLAGLRAGAAGSPESPNAEPGRREGSVLGHASAPLQPHTGWFGGDPADRGGGDSFDELQQMLDARRDLLDKLSPSSRRTRREKPALGTDDVLEALGRMQATESAQSPRSVHDVRQALLAQARQSRGEAAALSRDDSDAFELLGLLIAEIQRELRKDAPGSRLLHRLLLPLLRLVLVDREFFVQNQHPARQLLNAVAESGASWLPEDEGDPQLNDQLRVAVDEVVSEYRGDPRVFEQANQRVQQHLQLMARRAEVAERRHVEAVRGKEKLELAKRHASALIAEACRDRQLPRFVHTLLANAWTDVLVLTLLRHGEDSREWREQQAATRAIVSATSTDQPVVPPPQLVNQVEHWLTLVGYHQDEAASIAAQLTARCEDEDDQTATRTELALKLKARGRLGQEIAPEKPAPAPRSANEEAAYEVLRRLPFGTWFEFVTNQQGDIVRRRLSWYSPMTDHALFVNQRGQRVGEQSMDSLARAVAQGQARIVTADHSGMVDRAWHAAMGALRGFAPGRNAEDAR